MKILYVITKANFGGAQKYVFDLATAVQAKGHEAVLAYGVPGRLNELLEGDGVRTISVAGLSRDVGVLKELKAFTELVRLCNSERPDVVHVNSSKGGLALLAARVAGVPRVIFTAHGWAFNEARPWWQKLVIRAIYAVTLLLAHETICVSDAVMRDARYIPFARRTVIKNGMDAPSFLSRNEAQAFLASSAPKGTWIGMIAELHPTKRVEDAIAAIAKIPETVLVVLGEGEERARLENIIAKKKLHGRVFLRGFVADAPRYLLAFDLFLMVSRTEALAYAAIEAGYASLPVIASNVGGLPEIIKNKVTGLLVPPCTPTKLAEAISALRADPAYASRLGTMLRAHVEKEFSKERMIQQTFALYQS